ncbi:MAG: NifU family protein [bacterium]|nr:NifU family protein [bacterium]
MSQPTITEKIEAILEEIRPFLESHKGNAKLVEVDADNNITLELIGTCKGCPMSVMTFGLGVEKRIRERCPEVNEVFYQ